MLGLNYLRTGKVNGFCFSCVCAAITLYGSFLAFLVKNHRRLKRWHNRLQR